MKHRERELKLIFLEEASQILGEVENSFLALEENGQNKELLNQIFRRIHNIKGGASAAGFSDLAIYTHCLESFILEVSEEKVGLRPPIVSLLLEAKDQFYKFLEVRSQNFQVDLGIEKKIKVLRKRWADIKNDRPIKVVSFENPEDNSNQVVTFYSEESIRIPLSKMDTLKQNVEDLKSLEYLIEHAKKTKDLNDWEDFSNHFFKISNDISDFMASIRMVPLKNIMTKMQRLVRDISSDLKKEVQLQIIDEGLEIDQSLFQSVNDALLHLIRNAIDHGIESKIERQIAKKEKIASISIHCSYESNDLKIVLEDDGRGIALNKVREKAIAKKIIQKEDQISDKDLQNLIFHPGFSTKEEATEYSGRGIGMDVVKNNIEAVKGKLEIESREGKGSKFILIFPKAVCKKKKTENQAA